MIGLLDFLERQRKALIAVLAALTAAGAWVAFHMPAAILPEVAFPRITIIADSGERPPEDMVRTVTRPLEDAVRRVPELREVRSTTSRGTTEINLDCHWGAPMIRTLQLTQAQIDATRERLPAGTTVEARIMSPVQFPVLGFSLTSGSRSPAELRDLAIMRIKPELARLPDASEIIIQGGQRLEARVTLEPRALESRRLVAANVAETVLGAGRLESLGMMSANGELYLGLSDARPDGLDALRAVPVPVDSGPPVPLGALGRIALVPAPAFTRYAAGPGQAVLVNVLRKPSASAIRLSQAAHDWFRSHAGVIPPDVHVETFYDQSDLVRASVVSVRDSLVVGALMAILVVILFLRRVRLGLAAALVLPGSIAVTLCGLAWTGQTLNMMTLGGIAAAVGLVLDDAIVVVEHVAHRASESAAPEGVRRSVAEILPPLTGSSLCTLAIFIPFIYLGGVTGAFFRVLSLAMALMLASSLFLCVLIVPRFRIGPAAPPPHRGKLRQGFERALHGVMGRRWLAFAIPVALLLCLFPLTATIGSGFLPEMDEGSLILDYIAPPGSSLEETDRMLRHVEHEFTPIPEITEWSRRTGDQLGFFITEPNQGDYTLRLTRRHRKRSAEEIADALRQRIGIVEPALEIEFGQLVEDVVGDLTTSPEPIEVRILGEDRRLDEQRAAQIARILETIPGVVDVRSRVVVSGSNLVIAPGIAAQRIGLDAAALAQGVAPYVQGVDAGQIARGAREWPVRIVLPQPPGATGPGAIGDARVPVPGGRWVRLGDIANVRVQAGETEIVRDDQRTMAAATARLSGRDLGSAMREIQRRIRRDVVLGPGMDVRYAGLWAEQQSSFRGLAAVLFGAAAAVLLVLLVSFRSWSQAGAVLFVASASLTGVLAALHIGRATFNIASFVGAIMVVGIVAENAYFLVAAFRDGLANGMTANEAATAAASRRLRPVLMTTAAGIAALAPLALGIGSGSALLRPLAIAIIGGFMNSAFLLLIALPPLLALKRGRPAA